MNLEGDVYREEQRGEEEEGGERARVTKKEGWEHFSTLQRHSHQ